MSMDGLIDFWWKFLPAVSGGILDQAESRLQWILLVTPQFLPIISAVLFSPLLSLFLLYVACSLLHKYAHVLLREEQQETISGLWSNRNCVRLPFLCHHFLPSQEVCSECEQQVVERNLSAGFLTLLSCYSTQSHTQYDLMRILPFWFLWFCPQCYFSIAEILLQLLFICWSSF